MERVFNFSAGPATIDVSVLERAKQEMLCYGDSGMSVMEMSHRSGMYEGILAETKERLTSLLGISDNYEILFLQGGATLQFSGIPLNLFSNSKQADYVDSGNFANLAAKEAMRYGDVRIIASSKDDNYSCIPDLSKVQWNEKADYAYITTNNTIYGTRYKTIPDTGAVPLVADMSSNILSEPIDVNRFGVIFAGAQKNIGPAGLCLVVVRKDLLGRENPLCPKLMNWALQAKNNSMVNTPNTYGIYIAKLVFEWIENLGGLSAMKEINERKASKLYQYLDESKLFTATAKVADRSLMNVTFVTGDKDMDAKFIKYATENGLVNLKGHRNVGGMRASIYNAMPEAGVDKLVQTMIAFEKENV